MNRKASWLLYIILPFGQLFGQDFVVQTAAFFSKDSVVDVTLNTNLKNLNKTRKSSPFLPGTITWHNPDGAGEITERIQLKMRGNFRKENCALASLMLDFRDSAKKSKLSKLGKVKLVAPCESGTEYQQYVLQEYLIYKMYNLLTDASFRVRLLNLTIQDSIKAKKHFKQYAFLIEPAKSLAKRKNWVEESKKSYNTEQTNREQATLVFMFQYMVGNTDWAVPSFHNIKLFFPKDSAKLTPYIVPYDFDFSGLINAPYASPPESTGLSSVTERFYMGYVRTPEELRLAANVFLAKKNEILDLVKNFELIDAVRKREMTDYLEDFFRIASDDQRLKEIFIENALNAK
jgi:hypothetical protein